MNSISRLRRCAMTDEKVLILIQDFTRTGLQKKCDGKGLPTTGTKEELARLLVEHEEQSGSMDTSAVDQFHDVETTQSQGTVLLPDIGNCEEPTCTSVHPYSFRDVEESIPAYGKDNTTDFVVWLEEFEAVAKMARWSEDQKFIMCRKKMTGSARNFLSTVMNITTYPALKKALLAEFGKKARPPDVHRQLANRRRAKDETALDYVYNMQRIAKQIDLDEESVCEYIVDGITNDEMQRATLYEARTISELKMKIELRERATQKGSTTRKAFVASHGANTKQQTANVKMRCYNCGEHGHRSSQCVHKNSGPKCFKCGEYGHVSTKCAAKGERTAHQRNVLLVQTMPSIPVKIMEQTYNATVDTGSEVTLLREDVYKTIPRSLQKWNPATQRLYGLGGKVTNTFGEAIVHVTVGEEKCEIKFDVIPDTALEVPVLLGMNFLRSVDFTITNTGVTIQCKRDDTEQNEKTGDDQKTMECPTRIYQIYGESEELNVPYQWRKEILDIVNNYTPSEGVISDCELNITLQDNSVVRASPRRLAPLEKKVVCEQIEQWLEDGIVRFSDSPYASALVVVPKKDGSYRVCVDYREINKRIVRDPYPMPNIEDQIDQLADARVYTTLDLKNSYFHVPIKEESRKYTAFVTPQGQYEFMRAPFGLCTSGSAFGRFIDSVFRKLTNEGVMLAFVDDIIIPSRDEEQGLAAVKCVLDVAQKAGLQFNWKKCVFLQRRVEYLGYQIYEGRIEPASQKVEKVRGFPFPKNAKQLQRFYGLASYFRKFVANFAEVMRPLSVLLKKDERFEVTSDVKKAFDHIKTVLSQYPVLRIFKSGLETEVHTDASKEALAGILMQRAEDDGRFHPCYYYSRLTNQAEKNYHSFDLESLAVVESVKKFRCYLLGQRFKIVTDCIAFKQSLLKKNPNARTSRWLDVLAEFEYAVEHRSAERMRHVDALSRANVMVVTSAVCARIAAAQRADSTVAEIMRRIERDGSYDEYTVSDGVLHKGCVGAEKLYVPDGMQIEIIRSAHEQGHFGVKKTKERIGKDYFIPNVESKIEKCIASCMRCIVGERKRGQKEGELHSIPKGSVPLDTWHVDHLGPMPSTRKSYNYIFTIVDAFTKFIWLFPVKSTTAEEVIKKLKIVANTFGNPRRIVSDRGAAFTSKAFEDYCAENNVEVHKIVTGVPRGNGQVERIHGVIIPVLTKLSIEKPDEWFKHVERVQTVINNSWQRAIGMTPFELFIGVKMKTKEDIMLSQILKEEMQKIFNDGRDELRQHARQNIIKMQEENRKYYNLRRKKTRQYKVGDLVALPVTQFRTGGKVKRRFLGPYEIRKILPNDRYEVRKVDEEDEGPVQTTTAGDELKNWTIEYDQERPCGNE